ncbi:MAG: hypothetical protein ACF8QF_02950 [Phycisphaerales bacterium]
MVGALVGGLIAALIGAGAWAGIGFATGYEIGWIAWGVGGLVGLGVHIGGREKLGAHTGLLAGALAALAVAGGKYAVVYATLDRELGGGLQVTDENVISYIADEFVAARIEAGDQVEWPRGVDPSKAWVQSDYPPDVWADAVARWNALDESERDQWRALAPESLDTFSLTNQVYTSTFNLFDLLWFALAVGTAYKLGSGGDQPGP